MGGRPDFVGSTLYVNGQPYTVIGVTPEGFSGISALLAPDVWLPLGIYSQLGSAFSDSSELHDLGAAEKLHASMSSADCGRGLTLEHR